MALDVSGSQIYAGRYHYRRSEMPDLFRRITGYMMKQQVAAGFLARHVTLWI